MPKKHKLGLELNDMIRTLFIGLCLVLCLSSCNFKLPGYVLGENLKKKKNLAMLSVIPEQMPTVWLQS